MHFGNYSTKRALNSAKTCFIRAQKLHFRDYLIFVYFAAQKVLYCTFVIVAQKVHFRDYSTKKKFQIRENGKTSLSQKVLHISTSKLEWIEEREKYFLAKCITKNR